MNWNRVRSVFYAEYYTTTSKFRNLRKYIPISFLVGVFLFSFVLRLFYSILLSEQNFQIPDIVRFYSIITIFSYFTLFAPLLSPLGRIVYDGSARSRREVALATPVESAELLYGNLLSNLVFYLPFFGFVGTMMLAPFFGSGKFSPALTALILFLVLSLLILIGLITGTIFAPIISLYVMKFKSNVGRAIVTLGIAFMLVTSLPLFRYLVDNGQNGNNYLPIFFLPFTIAASIIIYTLYDVRIGVSFFWGFVILFLYLGAILLISNRLSDWLYSIGEEEITSNQSKQNAFSSKFAKVSTFAIPRKYRLSTQIIFQASLRDIEEISRLSIGVAVTIFMVFAFSGQGLFEGTVGFTPEIQAAFTIMAIVSSAGTLIFIETSSFIVQHRSLLEIIKSSPLGPRKFIVSKIFQVNLIILPLFGFFLVLITPFGFLSIKTTVQIFPVVLIILNALISICLCIYLINPIDNEEDIANFINLIVFYIFVFTIVLGPLTFVLSGNHIKWYHVVAYLGILILISQFCISLSVKLLDQMNVENLRSILSDKINHGAKTILWVFIGWNILPLFVLPVLLITQNIFILLLCTDLIILVIPVAKYKQGKLIWPFSDNKSSSEDLKFTVLVLIVMFISSIIILLVGIKSSSTTNDFSFLTSFDRIQIFIFLIIQVVVEEIFFRWFLYDYAKEKLNVWTSRILTSVLFGLLHLLSIASFVNAVIQGIWLTIIRDRTKSIDYPILAHFVFNFLIFYLAGF